MTVTFKDFSQLQQSDTAPEIVGFAERSGTSLLTRTPIATLADSILAPNSYATPYAKTLSDIINGDVVSIYKFINTEHVGACQAGTSTYDAREDVQKALDSGAKKIDATFGRILLSVNPSSLGVTGQLAAGSSCLNISSGQELTGNAEFVLVPGSSPAQGAMLTNWIAGELSYVKVSGIKFNGNKTATTGNMTGVQLHDATRCKIGDIIANACSFNGWALRRNVGVGPSGNYGSYETFVEGARVIDPGYIGGQAERPFALRVIAPIVSGSGDNSYDIEGNDPASGGSAGGLANLVTLLALQSYYSGGNALFLESAGDVLASGCYAIGSASHDLVLNRIISAAFRVLYSDFVHVARPGATASSVIIMNSSGRAFIKGGSFDGYLDSIVAAGGVDRLTVGSNVHRNLRRYAVNWQRSANALVRSYIDKQIFEDGGAVSTQFPAAHPPLNYPGTATQTYNVISETSISEENATRLLANYQLGTNRLQNNAAWGGTALSPVYALYDNGGDGKTRASFRSLVAQGDASIPTNGFIGINGSYYKIGGTPGDGSLYVMQWNGTTFADGNFLAQFNDAWPVDVYHANWGVAAPAP